MVGCDQEFCVSRTRSLKSLLDWTEAQGGRESDQSTLADGIAFIRDVYELSRQLWALLNLNLTDNQKKTHQAVRVNLTHGGHGLEVWRKLVCPPS